MHEISTKPNESGVAGEDPLEALSARYRAALTGYFRKRVHDAQEAEDLAQEVFLRILRRGDVAGIANVRAYLFEIASSVLIDRSRRESVRHKARHAPFDPDDHGALDFPSERVHLGREALLRVSAALLELPARSRTIFVLRRLEGMKYSDIARRLNISVSAVEKHMARAITYLTQRMGDT